MLSPAPTLYKKLWHLLPVVSIGLLVAYLFLFSFRKTIEDYNTIQLILTRAAVVLLLLYSGYEVLYKKLKTFLLQPMQPINLGIFRLVYFGFHVVALVIMKRSLATEALNYANYSMYMRIPVEGAEWLSLNVPVSQSILDVVVPLYSISLVCSFVGLFTRISTKVHLATLLYVCFVPLLYGKVVHLHHMLWFPAILAFSNCGHSLSLDRLIGKYLLKKTYNDDAQIQFGIPVKVGILLLGIIYFFPGFWKLWTGGFDWIFSLNINRQMYIKWGETNGWLPLFRLDAYPVLALIAAILTVAFEFGFIFLSFYKRWRPWLILMAVAMHTGIYLFMDIPFFTLLPMYVLLIDWGSVLNKNAANTTNTVTAGVSKLYGLYLVSAVLLLGNVYAGFTKLNSYPFACYPTFEYMVADEMDYVRYLGYYQGKQSISHAELKQEICSTMPDYTLRAIEYKLLDAHAKHDSLQVQQLANNIFAMRRSTNKIDSIVIYKAHGGISPEGAKAAKLVEPIYSIGYK